MTKTIDDIAQRIAVAIDASRKAKVYDAEANPVGNATLADIVTGSGIDKGSDLLPQRNQYGFVTQGTPLAESLNQVVTDGLKARGQRRSDQRKARQRARAVRIAAVQAVADEPVQPDPARMALAWAIMRPLMPHIGRIAAGKAKWARRFLGTVSDDVTQAAVTRFALYLAKSDLDLDLYLHASEQLADERDRIPGDIAITKDMSKQRKREAKARKSLMSLCNHMVMTALADVYRETHNLRWETIDILETVMANVGGMGEDPAFRNFQASKPPAFIASRPVAPGALNPDVLRIAIAAAVTDRRLDALVELFIDETNLRTDGSFTWTANAERVFMCTADGEHKWQAVCMATEHHADPAHSRAQAARMYARQQFGFMPWLIQAVVAACEPQRIGYSTEAHRAIIACAFDAKERAGLLPVAEFGSVRDAADILAEALACVLAEFDSHTDA